MYLNSNMSLYHTNNVDEPRPIDLEDIIFLTKQMRSFIDFYKENIYLKNDNEKQKLAELEYYTQLLEQGRFDMLFKDPSVIRGSQQSFFEFYNSIRNIQYKK